MRGSVVRKGTRWYVIVEGKRDPTTKKRRRIWHSGFSTRREAEAGRALLVSQFNAGDYVEPKQMALGHFLVNQWLPSAKKQVRESTVETYEFAIRHLLTHLGDVQVQDLTPRDIDAFYSALMEGPAHLSARSVRIVHSMLSKALETARDWGYVRTNAARAAHPPQLPTIAHKTWDARQVSRFLESAASHELRAAWRLAATTGMRRGEVLGVRNADVDTSRGLLSIRQTLTSVDYRLVFSTPKTASGRRTLILDGRTNELLDWHINHPRQTSSRIRNSHDLVFVTRNGDPVHPDAFSKSFRKLVEESDLPPLSLHGLRHSYATIALQAGVNPKVVSERLGHSSVSVTLEVYSHVMPELQAAAANEIAALIDASAESITDGLDRVR